LTCHSRINWAGIIESVCTLATSQGTVSPVALPGIG
jgi:hypothetical protein